MTPEDLAIPGSADEAADRVMQLVRAARSGSLHEMTDTEFKSLWPSVAYLYPGLHPDDAANHGLEICAVPREEHHTFQRFPELGAPYFEESGWPVALELVMEEAWYRSDTQRLSETEMYCISAQCASLGLVASFEAQVV